MVRPFWVEILALPRAAERPEAHLLQTRWPVQQCGLEDPPREVSGGQREVTYITP